MAFNFQSDADLLAPVVRDFLNNRDKTVYRSPAPGSDDKELIVVSGEKAQKLLGPLCDTSGQPIVKLFGEVAGRIDVYKGRTLISSGVEAVPVECDVSIDLYAQLLVRKGNESIIPELQDELMPLVTDKESTKIELKANELALRSVNPIQRDQYLVSVFYTIVKSSTSEPIWPEISDLKGAEQGSCDSREYDSGSTIYGKNMCQVLRNGQYRVHRKELDYKTKPPMHATDPLRQVESANPYDPSDLHEIFKKIEDTTKETDCGPLEKEYNKVADIAKYTEYDIGKREAVFKIGPIRWVFHYPVLCTRLTTSVLYVVLGFKITEIDRYTKTRLDKLIKSAGEEAVVVFLTTLNLGRAYEYFKGAVIVGAKEIFSELIDCMLPEVIVKQQSEKNGNARKAESYQSRLV